MAEVLYNVAAGIILSLGSTAVNDIGLWWGVSDELLKLRRTVSTIQAVLLHAEEQSMDNPQVKNWLEMLNEALYDADDLLDEFSTEALRQQALAGSQVSKKVRIFFSSSNQFVFGLKMGHKVKGLRERLDEIAAEKNKFHLEERSVVERHFVSRGRDQTHSYPPEVVVGREQEKGDIVRLLLSYDCDENVSVVSIVGIGGLGKTTLAQMVYNDDRVKHHFELKIWVCVCDDFDVKLLVKKILESVTKKAPEPDQMDPLKDLLHERINGRRYLLVLDDVWNDDLQKWYNFKDLLAGGATGSKIVITTRPRRVAEMIRSISIHELRGLPDNDAWSLFKRMAFKQQQPPNPSLEAVGKEIVAKCHGVPLAIKTIGRMLYFKDSKSQWISFKDKELSTIDVYNKDILPILKLSYDHLPPHYKHCFAYCSLYPKDFKIPVDELIQLWKAQGYLKSINNTNESLRDVGFEYFMDLFQLSFFQDIEKDRNGNIEYCTMHDLMHDLAILVAGDNFFASHSKTACIQNKTQHMSFTVYQNSLSGYMSSLLKAKKIRTVLRIDHEFDIKIKEEEVNAEFCDLRRLRVLDLSNMEISTLLNSIYKLKHLRYLNLSDNYIEKLPNSIAHLPNLQVLKIRRCRSLTKLPSNITKLVNLTDLDNHGCEHLTHMPRGIGKMTGLESLSEFIIAEDHFTSKHSSGLDELRSLNNLRGCLAIRNLRYVKNGASECEAAHLSEKEQLQGLALNWVRSHDDIMGLAADQNEIANDEMGIEALCPHPNLKQLLVDSYRGVKPPSWLPSLTNLVSVRFSFCVSIQWLPPFDLLPYLKVLGVVHLKELERIDIANRGNSAFYPSLTHLDLQYLPKLKGRLSTLLMELEELLCFPCLSQLKIRGCPNLNCFPLLPKLKQLYSDGDGVKYLTELLKTQTNSASESFSTLSQLQELEISDMADPLEDELLQYLPSLQFLQFSHCSFTSVCRGEKDGGVQWQSLQVLRTVELHFMENLVSLPEGFQYVTTLRRLHISYCRSLACIPEWMPKLVSLQDLSISHSALLEERCNNNSAPDWPRISHARNISVGQKPIQRNNCYLL